MKRSEFSFVTPVEFAKASEVPDLHPTAHPYLCHVSFQPKRKEFLSGLNHNFHGASIDRSAPLPYLSTVNHKPEPTQWLYEELFFDESKYFDAVKKGIRSATKAVWLETYIFKSDVVGISILEHLLEAAKRGLDVRLMVDGFGSLNEISNIENQLRGSRVMFCVYNQIFHWSLFEFSKKNRRLHRKTVIVDEQVLFTGSFNVLSAEQRDSGICVTGTSVKIAHQAFLKSWSASNFRTQITEHTPNLPVRVNDTSRLRRVFRKDFRQRIERASERIWLTNAYFVPPFRLLRALIHASINGADVRLLLPGKSDSFLMKLLTETFYLSLLLNGISIFEYSGNFLHAKTSLVDNWATVGSTNLNHRSWIHDLEIDVVAYQSSTIGRLESQFLLDLENSRAIQIADLERRPLLLRILGWVMRVFRYWL